MKTYKIHLIRHGITQDNLDGRYVGHTDVPLCEEGLRELRKLKKDFIYPQTETLFSSPLTRCLQTAEIIFPEIKPIIIPDFIEYDFGEFDGKTANEIADQALFTGWLSGDADSAPPFGESNRQFGVRVCKAFAQVVEGLLKTGTTSASIVAHGGVIMAILAAFGLPEAPMLQWIVKNGCGYTISITPSLWMRCQKFEVENQLPIRPENEFYDLKETGYFSLNVSDEKIGFDENQENY